MKPLYHARISMKRYGGAVEDYMPVHDFMDSSKIAIPDMRHRAILHNSFGIYLAERVFGATITNSDGKQVCVRDIAEDHVKDDLGFIPTIERWFQNMELEPWMTGAQKKEVREESMPEVVNPYDGVGPMPFDPFSIEVPLDPFGIYAPKRDIFLD